VAVLLVVVVVAALAVVVAPVLRHALISRLSRYADAVMTRAPPSVFLP
jgi:hypothetical protein